MIAGRAPSSERLRLGRGRQLLAAGAVAALGAFARPAGAHAPPLGARVLASASGDEVIVTNRGLVFRDPETDTSRLLCNEALRITTAEVPHVALVDAGLLVASSSGLRLSRDRGCSWADVGGMETTNTPALASAPGDPNTVYVASYSALKSGILVTRDGARTWSMAVETDASDYVHSLLVGGDGAHVYATLTTYLPSEAPAHALLRSVDGGQSWERRPLPLGDADYAARAAATHPDAAATLLLYTVANSPGLDDSRLLVSTDAGDSFAVALTRPEIRGADFDAEGRAWVAARDGLYRAAAAGEFERVSDASELGCVGAYAGGLLVCGHYAGVEAGRSGVGVSRDSGRSFDALLDFDRVDAPVACDDGSLTTTLCAQPWRDWEAEMLGALPAAAAGPYGSPGAAPPGGARAEPPPVDGGTSDTLASTTELAAAPDAAEGCGLRPARARSSASRWIFVACFAAAIGRGRRRARRPVDR